MDNRNQNFETIAIRTQVEQTQQKEHSVPLYLTSSFTFDSAEQGAAIFAGEQEGNLYSRFSNPNSDEFALKLALLEGAESGVATASGMAAVFVTFAALLQQGDHVLVSKSIFGNTVHIINDILPKWGIEHTWVDILNEDQWEDGFQLNTKLAFVETPSNPSLDLIDLTWLAQLAHAHHSILVVDNCFATPYLQRPIEFGADIVIHSATKYLDGQGRVLGGAILGSDEHIKKCYDFIRRTGPSLSPFNSWVLSKSLETLAIRMDRHCSNALDLASVLQTHPEVEKVIYPGLSSFVQFELAKSQMNQGGGIVACILKGGKERGAKFLNALQMHSLTANLGDTRSIATHPASTTHSKLSEEARLEVGIFPGLVRFSVGLEHASDIIGDVVQALKHSK